MSRSCITLAAALAGMLVATPAFAGVQEELAASAAYGNVWGVKAAIERGANINERDVEGYTALTWAAQHGSVDVCKMLLDRYAQVNAADKAGYTPLMWAAQEGHGRVVDLLLARGANPGVRDKRGNTALALAYLSGRGSAMPALQAAEARWRAANPYAYNNYNYNNYAYANYQPNANYYPSGYQYGMGPGNTLPPGLIPQPVRNVPNGWFAPQNSLNSPVMTVSLGRTMGTFPAVGPPPDVYSYSSGIYGFTSPSRYGTGTNYTNYNPGYSTPPNIGTPTAVSVTPPIVTVGPAASIPATAIPAGAIPSVVRNAPGISSGLGGPGAAPVIPPSGLTPNVNNLAGNTNPLAALANAPTASATSALAGQPGAGGAEPNMLQKAMAFKRLADGAAAFAPEYQTFLKESTSGGVGLGLLSLVGGDSMVGKELVQMYANVATKQDLKLVRADVTKARQAMGSSAGGRFAKYVDQTEALLKEIGL